MDISHIDAVENIPLVPFYAKTLFNHKETGIILVRLLPGEEMQPHKNEAKVIFLICNGSGELTVNNEKVVASPGHLITVLPEEERGWINNTKEVLEFVVIKTIKL